MQSSSWSLLHNTNTNILFLSFACTLLLLLYSACIITIVGGAKTISLKMIGRLLKGVKIDLLNCQDTRLWQSPIMAADQLQFCTSCDVINSNTNETEQGWGGGFLSILFKKLCAAMLTHTVSSTCVLIVRLYLFKKKKRIHPSGLYL